MSDPATDELFPFQLIGAAHLNKGRARLLGDEMGLGKTPQALRASEARPDQRVTVICPAIMCAEWYAEFWRWHQVPRTVAIAGPKPGWQDAQFVICSYDRVKGDVYESLRARRGTRLIFDEAQYLKNIESNRTINCLGEGASGKGGLAAVADSINFLTGTPAPNDAGELYPFLTSCGVYDGTYWQFFREFCTYRLTEYGPRATGYKDAPRLKALLAQIMLRRTNAVELPPTDRGEIVVEPSECGGDAILPELRRLDAAAASTVRRAAELQDFSELDTPHLATLRRLIGLAKVSAVADRAAEILTADPTAKIVLFCIHRTVIEQLSERLRDFGPAVLAGGESDKARRDAKTRFQTAPDCRVAVCQMKAAGTGLTLTAANHLWIVEPSWTPADNDQAVKRIVRIGQTRRTSIQYVTLAGSVDEATNRVLRKKRQLIDLILN